MSEGEAGPPWPASPSLTLQAPRPELMRYVERNALRAGLVERAEGWPWGSLAFRSKGWEPTERLSAWPVAMPADWLSYVNRAQTAAEVEAVRRSVTRGTPFGTEGWQRRTAGRLGLEHTLRPTGRPRKGDSCEAAGA